jgi:gamma-glutamylcyclotransferase (GGCT)/AIG2-like uncharacterized protein YtfP
MNLIFTYGTLRHGEGNWHRLLNKAPISTEVLKGFDMYTHGAFPYAVRGSGTIVAELYEVDDKTFARLDHLEGYPVHYDRMLVKTEDGREAWIYFSQRESVKDLHPIKSGDWMEFLEAPEEVA